MIWGASEDDWLHFDLVLGLSQDLLPVVSNPDAAISERSKLKSLGKTPSRYNGSGEVAGIAKWTQLQATPAQLAAWAREPDYGICVQTRLVRALDIDVDDVQLATEIEAFVLNRLGKVLPRRWRHGVGRRVLVFRLPGDLGKRSFRVEGGLVEFLATGQQFVAVGTHPSGSRYQWVSEAAIGLPDIIPELTLEQWDELWVALVAEFALPGTAHETRLSERSANLEGVEDEVAQWLVENTETYGLSSDGGRLYVPCPWKVGHTSDSGETEAAWLLAGTGGKQRGHFKCLHASCAARTDAEYLTAVGHDVGQFSDLSSEVVALYEREAQAAGVVAVQKGEKPPRVRLPLPGFMRDKQGQIEPVLRNVVLALEHPDACGYRLRFDTFRSELVIASPDVDDWRPYDDADGVQLRINLGEIDFKEVGKEMMRDAVTLVAKRHQFDTAQLWLCSLPKWDGVPRVDSFFHRFFGVTAGAYASAVSRYAWTALAGRVMAPGCQVDMVPVLQGAQGQRKTSGVAAIAPNEEFFVELKLDDKDDNLSRLMRGRLVAELAELKGLNSRDSESIRAWITKRYETWTPKFKEYAVTFPRRLLLIGTVNPKEFLADETGERRWLPMAAGVAGDVDPEGVAAARDQLWAEGLVLWQAEGVAWREAERLARVEHAAFKVTDPWTDAVCAWLDEDEGMDGVSRRARGNVRTLDVLREAVGLDVAKIAKREEMRVATILQAQGMVRDLRRVDGKPARVWDMQPPVATS